MNDIKTTTTSFFPGHEIVQVLGPVYGCSVHGRFAGKEILSKFSDFFGGKSGSWIKSFDTLAVEAHTNLVQKAQQSGQQVDAIIDLHFDTTVTQRDMPVVTAFGTAVRLRATTAE